MYTKGLESFDSSLENLYGEITTEVLLSRVLILQTYLFRPKGKGQKDLL